MGQLSLLLWSWIEATRSLLRASLWGPFFAYVVIQWVALLGLTQFHQPLLAGIVTPLVHFLSASPVYGGPIGDGGSMLHYPLFFLVLPALFSRLQIFIDLLFGAWLIGAAFLLFWQADRPTEPFRGVFGRATRSWGRLIGVRLPATLLLVPLVFWAPRLIFGEPGEIGGNLLRLRQFWPIAAGSLVEALFLYAPLAVLVERRGIAAAVARSVRIALRIPVATLGAVLIPNLVQVPIYLILRRSETIITRLSPEVVGWLLGFLVAVYTVATFYIVATGTRLFRVQAEASEG